MTDFTKLSQFNQAMLEDYERCLRRGKCLPKTYFSECSTEQKTERAILLFQYFFEKIVEWTPNQIINYLSKDVVVKQAKLSKAYSSLEFPAGFSKADYFYIAKLCYPNEVGSLFDYKGLIILRYRQVLESGKSFPKKYFDTPDGQDKARIIMQYALLTSEHKFLNIEDLYEYFSKKKTANEFLSKAKLKTVCAMSFSSPLEFMHYSLAPQQRNDLLFNYYKIKNLLADNKIKI